MALMIGKQATSAYERNKKAKEEGKAASPSPDTQSESSSPEPGGSVTELIGKIEDAIDRRNWKLLESFWSDLRPMLSKLEEEEASEGEEQPTPETALGSEGMPGSTGKQSY